MKASRCLLLLLLVILAGGTSTSNPDAEDQDSSPADDPSPEPSPASDPTTITDSLSTITASSVSVTDNTLTSSSNDIDSTSSSIDSDSTSSSIESDSTSSSIDSNSTSPSNGIDSTTTVPQGASDPCKDGTCGAASCINLHSKHFCLCIEGYYYDNGNCARGKTFPGKITVQIDKTSNLNDENSPDYQELYDKVMPFFKDALSEVDYKQTIIDKVSTSTPSARSLVRAANSVYVSVVNILSYNTKQTEATVSNLIKAAAENDTRFKDYSGQDRCGYYGCESDDNDCNDFLNCKCKPGLQRPSPQSRCSGLNCVDQCDAENKKQCVSDGRGNPQCVCLPGYKNTDGKCEECPFGYSGNNCENQFQLILTIVGTIAGFLILSLVIALIVSARSKNKHKKVEEQHLINNDFQSLRLQHTGFSNAGAEGNIFPKVRTSATRDGPSQNPYVSQRNIPRPDY